MNRVAAHSIVVLSILTGGGSFLVFGAFLLRGPFSIVRFPVSEPQALLIDGGLSILFFLQHSGMVRTSFRTWLSSSIPTYYGSAIYAIASGTVLTAVLLLWQPSHTLLFEVHGLAAMALRASFILALAGSIWGVRALGAFDPFGRTPIAAHLAGKQSPTSQFTVRGPYLWVRHPLYFFMLVIIWAAPVVSADRLLFNVLWTTWLVLGSYLEEKSLVALYGSSYLYYQATVPMILPWRGRAARGL